MKNVIRYSLFVICLIGIWSLVIPAPAGAMGEKPAVKERGKEERRHKRREAMVKLKIFVETTAEAKAELKFDDLDSLPKVEIIGESRKPQVGPLLIDVLKKAGIQDGFTVKVLGLGGQAYTLAWSDIVDPEKKIVLALMPRAGLKLVAETGELAEKEKQLKGVYGVLVIK